MITLERWINENRYYDEARAYNYDGEEITTWSDCDYSQIYVLGVEAADGEAPWSCAKVYTTAGIPADVVDEIDFMLGSIEECNAPYMVPILADFGIFTEGGWIDIDQVPREVVAAIYERLFLTGTVKPFDAE